ncbi:MAG: lysophospholipase [Dehalococcoidia bacterium]|nr:lysophospholipase [Dehalococcoidia bacterium]
MVEMTTIRHEEYMRRASDGTRLFFQSWRPSEREAGVMCLVHGHGEHSGRYESAVEELTVAGFAVHAFDLRGHGRSEGHRGDTPSYTQLMDDVGLLLREAGMACPGRVQFLFGHSLGGNLALNYVLRRKPLLGGAICTAPWLDLAFRPPLWRVAAMRILGAFKPGYPASSKKGDAKTEKNDDWDGLMHGIITPRLFFESRDAANWARHNAHLFGSPLLIVHGGDDRATSDEGSKRFVADSSGDATFTLWPNLSHNIHREDMEADLFRHIAAWTALRL